MKLKDAAKEIVEQFGSPKERAQIEDILMTIEDVFGDRDVSDSGVAKVIEAGNKLQDKRIL